MLQIFNKVIGSQTKETIADKHTSVKTLHDNDLNLVNEDMINKNILKPIDIEQHLTKNVYFNTIVQKIASILNVKSTNVVVRFINKMNTQPNYDPILALSVVTPFLEQDKELLEKVERLVYGATSANDGFFLITASKDEIDQEIPQGTPTLRKRRQNVE